MLEMQLALDLGLSGILNCRIEYCDGFMAVQVSALTRILPEPSRSNPPLSVTSCRAD